MGSDIRECHIEFTTIRNLKGAFHFIFSRKIKCFVFHLSIINRYLYLCQISNMEKTSNEKTPNNPTDSNTETCNPKNHFIMSSNLNPQPQNDDVEINVATSSKILQILDRKQY